MQLNDVTPSNVKIKLLDGIVDVTNDFERAQCDIMLIGYIGEVC